MFIRRRNSQPTTITHLYRSSPPRSQYKSQHQPRPPYCQFLPNSISPKIHVNPIRYSQQSVSKSTPYPLCQQTTSICSQSPNLYEIKAQIPMSSSKPSAQPSRHHPQIPTKSTATADYQHQLYPRKHHQRPLTKIGQDEDAGGSLMIPRAVSPLFRLLDLMLFSPLFRPSC